MGGELTVIAHVCYLLEISRIQLDPPDLREDRQNIFEAQNIKEALTKLQQRRFQSIKEGEADFLLVCLCQKNLYQHYFVTIYVAMYWEICPFH